MSDLDILLERLRAILQDEAKLSWSDSLLTDAIRQALEDMLNAAGEAWLLGGLDGSTHTTNFPTHYFALLTRGALGYALLMQAAERSNSFSAANSVPATLAAARAHLERFEKALPDLHSLRLTQVHNAAQPPYPASQGGWPLE